MGRERYARALLLSILDGVDRWTNGVGQMGIGGREEGREGMCDLRDKYTISRKAEEERWKAHCK